MDFPFLFNEHYSYTFAGPNPHCDTFKIGELGNLLLCIAEESLRLLTLSYSYKYFDVILEFKKDEISPSISNDFYYTLYFAWVEIYYSGL